MERNAAGSGSKHIFRHYFGEVRFPKLDECAHFHYERVELGQIELAFYAGAIGGVENVVAVDSWRPPYYGFGDSDFYFTLVICSIDQSWLIRRTYSQLQVFDKQIHQCAWDRHVSRLPVLPSSVELSQVHDVEAYRNLVSSYVDRVTALCTTPIASCASPLPPDSVSTLSSASTTSPVAVRLINCGPVLNWLELDNRGNRLIPYCEQSEINTPAVAAAHVIRQYESEAKDELQLDVGDIVSVIDMPPQAETLWWRGKRGLEVGYFPSDCVEVIGNTAAGGRLEAGDSASLRRGSRSIPVVSLEEARQRQPPVLRRRNKVGAFLRNFLANRPPRIYLREAGILRERVFGCDIGEHLETQRRMISGAGLMQVRRRDLPFVVEACCQFIEKHCIHTDGVYRLSGITSNIAKLRTEFDNPDAAVAAGAGAAAAAAFLNKEVYRKDVHCVPSVIKQYFRELPNPLLTYQLYEQFIAIARHCPTESTRLEELVRLVPLLPPPHYRTLDYLIRHLNRLTGFVSETSMTARNLAIVWAPNLLRRSDSSANDQSTPRSASRAGMASSGMSASMEAMREVGESAIIVELLIREYGMIFRANGDESDESARARSASRRSGFSPAAHSSFRISIRRSQRPSVLGHEPSSPTATELSQLEAVTPSGNSPTPSSAFQYASTAAAALSAPVVSVPLSASHSAPSKIAGGAKLISIEEAQRIARDRHDSGGSSYSTSAMPSGKKISWPIPQQKSDPLFGHHPSDVRVVPDSAASGAATAIAGRFSAGGSAEPFTYVDESPCFDVPPPAISPGPVYANLTDFVSGQGMTINGGDTNTNSSNFRRLRSQSERQAHTADSEEMPGVVHAMLPPPIYANLPVQVSGLPSATPPPPPVDMFEERHNATTLHHDPSDDPLGQVVCVQAVPASFSESGALVTLDFERTADDEEELDKFESIAHGPRWGLQKSMSSAPWADVNGRGGGGDRPSVVNSATSKGGTRWRSMESLDSSHAAEVHVTRAVTEPRSSVLSTFGAPAMRASFTVASSTPSTSAGAQPNVWRRGRSVYESSTSRHQGIVEHHHQAAASRTAAGSQRSTSSSTSFGRADDFNAAANHYRQKSFGEVVPEKPARQHRQGRTLSMVADLASMFEDTSAVTGAATATS